MTIKEIVARKLEASKGTGFISVMGYEMASLCVDITELEFLVSIYGRRAKHMDTTHSAHGWHLMTRQVQDVIDEFVTLEF